MRNDLKFVRITSYEDFKQIPKELFEQMKYKDFDVARIYEYAPSFLLSHQTWFYALVDEGNFVKGILWATREPVQNVLMINMMSVDSEYRGGMVKKATDFLFEEIKKTSLRRKILWVQKRWKPLVRSGWSNTDKMLMEISREI